MAQQNSANAEESASASEEMNARAEQMRMYVRDLVLVVDGSVQTRVGIPEGSPARRGQGALLGVEVSPSRGAEDR